MELSQVFTYLFGVGVTLAGLIWGLRNNNEKISKVENGSQEHATNIKVLTERVDSLEEENQDLKEKVKQIEPLQTRVTQLEKENKEVKDKLLTTIEERDEARSHLDAKTKEIDDYKRTVAEIEKQRSIVDAQLKEHRESTKFAYEQLERVVNALTSKQEIHYVVLPSGTEPPSPKPPKIEKLPTGEDKENGDQEAA